MVSGVRRRILIVDDDEDIRMTFRSWLEGERYEVEECSDGVEALEKITSQRYEVVIMDYDMPGLNASQVFAAMQRDVMERNRLIIVTGQLHIDSHELRRQGAFDVIYKPVEKDTLLGRIARLLR